MKRIYIYTFLFLISRFQLFAQVDEKLEKAKVDFVERVKTETLNNSVVASFYKTDGYGSEKDGMTFYTLEWDGVLRFNKTVYKVSDKGVWQNFVIQEAVSIRNAEGSYNKIFDGTEIKFHGDYTFQKTEQGWRIIKFRILSSKQISNNTINVNPVSSKEGIIKISGQFVGNFKCTMNSRESESVYDSEGSFILKEGKKTVKGVWEIVRAADKNEYALHLVMEKKLFNELVFPIIEVDEKHFVIKQSGNNQTTCIKVGN